MDNNYFHHLYISPLEQCNLCCKMCYTAKTSGKLTNQQIIDFVHRYHQSQSLQSITFCGGEIFLLPDFPALVNTLTTESFFVQIITNGTIDRLNEITNPNSVNVIVSLDGLPEYHDQNRGPGQWRQSIEFINHALKSGFHVEIFSIVTKENMPYINQFEKLIYQETGQQLPVTYHPRKPKKYLQQHPVSNREGEWLGFTPPDKHDRARLSKTKHIFPPQAFHCYQISLMSDGKIYGCCEGVRPLGDLSTPIPVVITSLQQRVYRGCVEPQFRCGLEEEICQ